jgi:pimeloyl-ACP methyl ester carboxylesterase
MLFQTSQRAVDTQTAEGLERSADDAELQAAPSLADRPLIVLAAGQNVAHDPIWAEAQRRQAALSTNGRLMVAEGSGHAIHWEQPALVIDALRQVIEDVRSR